ncbi:uncharacterized protein LOC105700960 isoform X2 [Orussus abietinus]|uniref:uncharacterized protein LOC105700960 isoform X2 n=1 Tax=Orussus abietinus TaxID=222816 RepID=UPI000626612B|nr:uncharacterized protein LOC105700960 isoform X2 [Orussus abietinus]
MKNVAVPAILIAFWSLTIVQGNFVREGDICGPHNGRRLYLELGEQGLLYGRNISSPRPPQDPTSRPQDEAIVTNSSHEQCSLELVTCPSCIIVVTFKSLNLAHHCRDGSVTVDSPCRCDYVWLSEPPYEDVSGTPFCGLFSPITHRSSTRTLSIALLYSQAHVDAFTIEYTSERNRIHLSGSDVVAGIAKTGNGSTGGILTSPFFPARYPRDLGMEYIVTCPSEAPSCRVRILFSDFQLATVSIMEFYDWNGQRLDVSSGARFRPPVIVSSGPSLLIRFYANGGTGLGYKAFYSYVVGHLYDKSIQPITDCGGYVENLGGAITMMDIVDHGVKTYDCVWLIRPPKNFLHMKTHMYIKVVAFAEMAGTTEVVIKQGPTSALMPLEVLRHPVSQLQPPRLREHVAPVSSGFHVSLRGSFGPTSRLAISYAAFSYMDCFTGSDFLCQNHRCIPSQLNCDGFDHCGDNSDEPTTCFREWELEPQDRKWHINKANYYFPKIDRYPDLKTATLVFVASSLGLIILISALIVLLYRMGARARQQRELQSRLQTISELLDGARIDEITVSDDPPVYEAPPGYDEVVKVGFEHETGRRRKRRSACREPRSRSSPSTHSIDIEQFVPLTSEGASTSRSSQTTPVLSDSKSNIPESPPPPYVTPPGTIPRNLDIFGLPSCSIAASGSPSLSRRGRRSRRAWKRSNTDQQSSSRTCSPQRAGPSASLDAEMLGAYLRDFEANLAEPSPPQSTSSCGVSTREKPGYEDTSISPEKRARDRDNLAEAETYEGEVAGTSDDAKLSCTCEGACGCASQKENLLQDKMLEPGSPCSKSSIIKLLGSSRNSTSPRRTGTAVSASSTPPGTLGRSCRNSFRKVSVRSRDSCVSRISNITGSNSYEKLQDEFEIISETASVFTGPSTLANTPIDTPKITSRNRSLSLRRYSNSDMDSLYEGIRILDTFLARRGNGVSARNQSVAVMVFGTPEHRARASCCETTPCVDKKRVWRSSDGFLGN